LGVAIAMLSQWAGKISLKNEKRRMAFFFQHVEIITVLELK